MMLMCSSLANLARCQLENVVHWHLDQLPKGFRVGQREMVNITGTHLFTTKNAIDTQPPLHSLQELGLLRKLGPCVAARLSLLFSSSSPTRNHPGVDISFICLPCTQRYCYRVNLFQQFSLYIEVIKLTYHDNKDLSEVTTSGMLRQGKGNDLIKTQHGCTKKKR